MTNISRRESLRLLAAPIAVAAFGAIPLGTVAVARPRFGRKLKVLVAGAHPDDPESGCGGTIARYVNEGHAVTALYLTRGEAGVVHTDVALGLSASRRYRSDRQKY